MLVDPLPVPTQGNAQFSIILGMGAMTGKNNQVQAPKEMLMKPKAFAHLTLNSMPSHCLADTLSCDRQSETRPRQPIGSIQNGEASVHRTVGPVKNMRILPGPR